MALAAAGMAARILAWLAITYVLTKDDPFAAIDLDHCRDASTGSIDSWAQKFLARSRGAYVEITPSGDGLRIWGAPSNSGSVVPRRQ